MSVAGVRVVEFGTKCLLQNTRFRLMSPFSLVSVTQRICRALRHIKDLTNLAVCRKRFYTNQGVIQSDGQPALVVVIEGTFGIAVLAA